MSDHTVSTRSGIPAAGFFLTLASFVASAVGHLFGYISLPFILIGGAVFVCFVAFLLSIRRWARSDPATRPAMKVPWAAILWTVGLIAACALFLSYAFDQYGRGFAL